MFNIVLSIFNRIPNVNISSSDNIQCGGFFSLNSLQLQSSSYSTEWLVEKKPDEKFPSEFDQTVLNHSASISPGTWTNYTNPLELDMKQQWHLQKTHRHFHDAVRPQTSRYRSYRLEQVPIVKQQNLLQREKEQHSPWIIMRWLNVFRTWTDTALSTIKSVKY